jgi:methionyl-tRNA formyltransferase
MMKKDENAPMADAVATSETKRSLRVLLFGIYDLGFRALKAMIARNLNIVGVVTKPECLIQEHALALLAQKVGMPVMAPRSPREASFIRWVKLLKPDLIAVSGYHKILPPGLLRIPPGGVLNLHGSLLPRYGGPCPWKWAIMNGETKTGATVQWMEAELDRGDILAQKEVPIDPNDTAETLFLRVSAIAGPLLAQTVEDYGAGILVPRRPDEQQATYQGYPTDKDARIHWEWDAERIRNRIRGLCPRPGAWTQYRGKRIRVRKAALTEGPLGGRPGVILGRSQDGLVVSTGRGNLSVSNMTVDGEDADTMARALRAVGMIPGTVFDTIQACESNLNTP